MRIFQRFLACEQGATAIEYCLIATFISIVIVGGATGIGPALVSKFTGVSNGLK